MIYLNIIYFLIITYYGAKFLFSGGRELCSVFDSENYRYYSGLELFWVLTFSTGLLAFSLDVGIDLMAVRLGVLELFLIMGLKISLDKPVWSLPLKIYTLYLIWLIIGCSYTPSIGYGIRVILKYLYPFLLCLFASAVVTDMEVFCKSSLWARKVGIISIVFAFVPFIGILVPGVFWYATAQAINFISIMIFSLAVYYYTTGRIKKHNLYLTILFIIPCFIWVFRTSIMGSFVAIMAFYFIKYRIKSLPIILGVLLLGVVAVFTIPSLRDKMFTQETRNTTIENFQGGGISMENVNTNAREAMWKYLENRMYKGHEITGSGTGAVQEHMYTHYIFGGLKVPHSDFVQIKCDNGIIGLTLYSAIALFVFLSAFKTYWETDHDDLKIAAIVAGASMAGVFATLYSDNSVNYSMATLSMPFGFYGMMLGIKRKYEE